MLSSPNGAAANAVGDPSSAGDAMDVNEIVAYNFRAARHLRGWTQLETAERLERYVGRRLTQAGISSIEAAYRGARRREFDAHELLIFSLTFDLPVVWFLLPPQDDNRQLRGTSILAADLHRIIYGSADQRGELRRRLRQLGADTSVDADWATATPSSHTDADRERLADILLALVYRQADPLDEALDHLGDFFEPLRRIGIRRFLAGHLTGDRSCAGAAPTDEMPTGPLQAQRTMTKEEHR
ncbi:MAG: hypothetical protein M3083_08740 [Actinomycetota bacterium]|nr:hypothetical protein [Actinomycetota bacterium]